MRIQLLVLFSIFFATSALAKPRTYDIDIIVFSHLNPQTLQAEDWPILANNVVAQLNQNTQLNDINPTYQLHHEKNVLEKSGYSVLYSGSIRRTWNSEGSSITIPIKNDTLAGNIIVELGYYFNVHTNLLMTEPTSVLQKMDTRGFFKNLSQPTFSFHFEQNRRMKSRELNYLETPLMGVLIKMNPVH